MKFQSTQVRYYTPPPISSPHRRQENSVDTETPTVQLQGNCYLTRRWVTESPPCRHPRPHRFLYKGKYRKGNPRMYFVVFGTEPRSTLVRSSITELTAHSELSWLVIPPPPKLLLNCSVWPDFRRNWVWWFEWECHSFVNTTLVPLLVALFEGSCGNFGR